MPEKVIHEIRLNQYIARPADLTRRFSLGTRDSYGVEQLRIVPGEGWDGLMITATFHPPEGEAVQVIVPADGLIDVPPEATRSGSELPFRYGKIVFAGVADGVQRISCNLPYTVMGHAPVDGAASSGPSPSWYEQAAAHFVPSGGKAGQVLAKASDTDLDVEWADGGNGTADHAKLSNRDASDQHPISAITGLETALDAKQPAGSYLTQESDPTVPDWAKAAQKPSYTASEVGADPSGTAAAQVAAHDTGADTHGDIRLLIQDLTDRLNALADSDDTTLDQLSEIVAYIKSNRDLISAITTDKVGVADIVNDLVTNVANKPLSAAQGVALKALIDAITIPTALPNPNALTFTGAVTGSYDGSAAVTVEIPAGGVGSYTLPIASPTTLGGVQPVAKTDEMTQAVGVDALGGLWALPGGGGSEENWVLVNYLNIKEDVSDITINTDMDGNAFAYQELFLWVSFNPVNDSNRLLMLPGSYWGSGEYMTTEKVTNQWHTLHFYHCIAFGYGIVLMGYSSGKTNMTATVKNSTTEDRQSDKYKSLKSWRIRTDDAIAAGSHFYLFGRGKVE